jgi:hypothetical protein
MFKEPKNEEAICAAVGRFLSERLGEELAERDRPDQRDRQNEAVELVLQSSKRSYAMEHTRIESFAGQIKDGQKFLSLLQPVEQTFSGRFLPNGKFDLIMPSGAASGIAKRDFDKTRFAIAKWVFTKAPLLTPFADREDDEQWSITERPDGLDFDLTLQRWRSDGPSRLLSMRFMPPELEEQRKQRIATAIEKKAGKLAAAKSEFDPAESILVLESDDIALANHSVIGDAVRVVLADHTELPDHIYLVETDSGLVWQLWILKEGTQIFPQMTITIGPFALQTTADDGAHDVEEP